MQVEKQLCLSNKAEDMILHSESLHIAHLKFSASATVKFPLPAANKRDHPPSRPHTIPA